MPVKPCRRGAPLALLAWGVVACSGAPLSPDPETGTFVLRSVAGTILPAPVLTNAAGDRYLVDTLRFEPRILAIFDIPTIERSTLLGLPGGGARPATEYIGYEREADNFSFKASCPPNANCAVRFQTGKLTGDRLEIVLPRPYRSPLRYERVR